MIIVCKTFNQMENVTALRHRKQVLIKKNYTYKIMIFVMNVSMILNAICFFQIQHVLINLQPIELEIHLFQLYNHMDSSAGLEILDE